MNEELQLVDNPETPLDEAEAQIFQKENKDEPIINNDDKSVTPNDSENKDIQSEESEEQTNPLETYKIKANGETYDFTVEDLVKLAPQALDYTRKMQTLAPFRRIVNTLEEHKISEADINQLIEMKKGDKVAISKFLKDINLSNLDLGIVSEDEVTKYKPNSYGKNLTPLGEVVESARFQTHPRREDVVNLFDTLDKRSQDFISQNPNILFNFLEDIDNGVYEQILSQAKKNALLSGELNPVLLGYYQDVAIKTYNSLKNKTQPQSNEENQPQKVNKNNLKSTGTKSAKASVSASALLDDYNEDDYAEQYYKIAGKYPLGYTPKRNKN